MMEYDPKPPFEAGTPELAGPEITGLARGLMSHMFTEGVELAKASRESRAAALAAH